jgi:thioredoxin reductase
MKADHYDAVIIGGGPAGLSAALWLGRYRRRVVVFDTGEPRNEPAWAVHGYPGIVDPSPLELRRRLQQQALGDGVEARAGDIVKVTGGKNDFHIHPDGAEPVHARRVILAYGLLDFLPGIEGIDALYGTSVFHCPDCDGPSFADTRIGVLGWNRYGARLALYLRHWSPDITLLTHGQDVDLDDNAVDVLSRAGIDIRRKPLARLSGRGGNLTQAEFADEDPLRLDAVFFHLGSEPRVCPPPAPATAALDRGQETTTAGVHAAGDITGQPHLAAIAAAEGVRAALAVHRSLLPPEYEI